MPTPLPASLATSTRTDDHSAASQSGRRHSSEHDQSNINSWRSDRTIMLDHIEEDDLPTPTYLSMSHRPVTPPPIGAERPRPRQSIPETNLTSSENTILATNNTNFNLPHRANSTTDPKNLFDDYPGPTVPTIRSNNRSSSSLSASAASFTSSSTPSPTSKYSASTYSYQHQRLAKFEYQEEPIQKLYPALAGLRIDLSDDGNQEVDTPDWDVLKRSIDATTMRGVWE